MKEGMKNNDYIKVELVDERLCRIEEIAVRANVSVSSIRRYMKLGLIKPVETEKGCLFVEGMILTRIAKIQRLKTDLGVNLSGIGVILDLLDRIEELNRQLSELKLRL